MQSGDLDQQIFLESLSEENILGQVTQTWVEEYMVWAKIITIKGTESFESAKVNSNTMIKVKLRYNEDITTKWRFKWMNQYYYINNCDRSLLRFGELWLMAELSGEL